MAISIFSVQNSNFIATVFEAAQCSCNGIRGSTMFLPRQNAWRIDGDKRSITRQWYYSRQ